MAVSANQLTKCRTPGRRRSFPVAATIHIYEGTIVFLTAGGYATDVIASGANVYAGIAIREVDNSGGSNGDKLVEVQDGEFELAGSGLTVALSGDKIYASDNYTITATSTNNTLIGRGSEFVSSTRLFVQTEFGLQT